VAKGQNDLIRHSGGGLCGFRERRFSACQGLHWCHEHEVGGSKPARDG
jgi:hypothetical protein